VVLGVDSGAQSGWCFLAQGKLIASGVARNALERADVVARAQNLERAFKLPLIVVAETWSRGGWMSFATILGMGTGWGRWAEALELAEHPARRIVRVLPSTWRPPTVGTHRGTEAYKAAAIARVRSAHRDEMGRALVAGPDEAEAICIADWGARSAEVAAIMPKRAA
jgi:hypothetical protein